jgi:hypothetical protein
MATTTGDHDPWLGTAEIARALHCPQRRVQLSLENPARADATYGRGMWTNEAKGPLSVRKVYGVRQSVVKKLASRRT